MSQDLSLSERVWVCVTEKTDDSLIGEIDNDPCYEQMFSYRDRISFKTNHIYQLMTLEQGLLSLASKN